MSKTEDNDDCRYLLALIIKRFGYEVVEAASGFAALDQASATKPDLILMDLGLRESQATKQRRA